MPKKNRMKWVLPINIAIIFFLTVPPAVAYTSPPVFATWDIFEVDKLASIWLIKNFIFPEAVIKLYPNKSIISEGIAFDTPDAEFRRYHNISTFEMLRRHYKINDPGVKYISRIVHDIEINTWERKVMRESKTVIIDIGNIIQNASDSKEIIRKGRAYFDQLYQR